MKTTIISLVILAVLGAGAYFFFNQVDSEPTPSPSPTASVSGSPAASSSPVASSSPAGPQTYTMAEVAQHSKDGDCWTVIEGKVYNLTNWVHQHPGGVQAILQLCGKDGTQPFTQQHDHAQQQQMILATFLIGTLAQ